MRRRSLLTALTAGTVGLAGCSFRLTPDGGDGSGRPEPTERVPTTTTARDPSTVVEDPVTTADPSGIEVDRPPAPLGGSVATIDAGPRTMAVRPTDWTHLDRVHLEFGFVEREADRPPHLGVRIRNAREHEVVVGTDSLPTIGRPIAALDGVPERSRLAFVPTVWNEIANFRPEVERGPEGYWQLGDVDGEGPLYPDSIRLEPGEGRRVDSAVVGFPGAPGLPTGLYVVPRGGRFELTVWHSDRPGPTDASRFGDRSVPSLVAEEPVRTVWYHQAGPETPVYVEPEAERAELPARVLFTAINHTSEAQVCGHWRLYKLVDGAFYDLSAPSRTGDCPRIRPGERKTHRLLAFAGDPVRDDVPDEEVVGHLGGGTYGVVTDWADDADASGALIEFSAPEVAVRPTDDVTADRDGTTMRVHDGERTDDAEGGTVTLTRAGAAETRLIAEQVMRPWNRAVRNTLAFVGDDVERVVLETTEHVVDQLLRFDDDPFTFSFRGEAYRLETDTPD